MCDVTKGRRAGLPKVMFVGTSTIEQALRKDQGSYLATDGLRW